jgi:hypothetical protein
MDPVRHSLDPMKACRYRANCKPLALPILRSPRWVSDFGAGFFNVEHVRYSRASLRNDQPNRTEGATAPRSNSQMLLCVIDTGAGFF